MRDTFCGTCAYRVNERVVRDAAIAFELVCLHPSVHREACADARDSRGPCGPDALKWQRKDVTPNAQVQAAARQGRSPGTTG